MNNVYEKLAENGEGFYFGVICWYAPFNIWSCWLDTPRKHNNQFEGILYSYHDKNIPDLPYTNIYGANIRPLDYSSHSHSVCKLEIIDMEKAEELKKYNSHWAGNYYIIMQFKDKKDFAKARLMFDFHTTYIVNKEVQ